MTLDQITTFGGSVTAVTVGTNAVSYAFQLNPKWLGLVLAFFVYSSVEGSSLDYAIAESYILLIVNVCILYLSAVGASDVAAQSKPRVSSDSIEENDGKMRFWNRWW